MSRTPHQVRGRLLSTNSGSVDSLKVSLRCGWRENARQMRCTVETDKPEALAIERQKHDPGPHRVGTRYPPATCSRLELTPLGRVQLDPNRRSPGHSRLLDRH